jgi:lipoprotein-releasing system ATP-binding protein
MLEVRDLCKEYPAAAGPLQVLSGIGLRLGRGESAAVMGPSGSGKSTLLHILGALDTPTSGSVELDGLNPFALGEAALARFRNGRVGFMFQDHCLLPQCTVLENVLAPTFVGEPLPDAVPRARTLLEEVGLGGRMSHRPAQLSGGEKQRTALARALIRKPLLLLCDEPTGNLDRAAAENVASLLLQLHREQNTILVVVTHSQDLAAHFGQQFRMAAGRLERR